MTTSAMACLRTLLLVSWASVGVACNDNEGTKGTSERDPANNGSAASASEAPSDSADETGTRRPSAKNDDAKAADPERRSPMKNGTDGAGGVLGKELCLLGAQRVAQTPPACLDCFCEAIATCGKACQDLLLCAVTQCVASFGEAAEATSCLLRECSSVALQSGSAGALTEGLAALATCGPVCRPPAAPVAPPPPTIPPAPSTPLPTSPPATAQPELDPDAGTVSGTGDESDAGPSEDAGA